MIDRKRDNLLRELKACFIRDKYEELVTEKIDWMRSLGIRITCLSTRYAVDMEQITYGGKVSWKKDSIPKKPLGLTLNTIDFRDTDFMVILLHECGHITDKDDTSVEFQTIESEISAWKHAIKDFARLKPDETEREKFSEIMKKALVSYKVDESVIQRMGLDVTGS